MSEFMTITYLGTVYGLDNIVADCYGDIEDFDLVDPETGEIHPDMEMMTDEDLEAVTDEIYAIDPKDWEKFYFVEP